MVCDDCFGLNLLIYYVFYEFYLIIKDFINIEFHDYTIEIIYISDHRKKVM